MRREPSEALNDHQREGVPQGKQALFWREGQHEKTSLPLIQGPCEDQGCAAFGADEQLVSGAALDPARALDRGVDELQASRDRVLTVDRVILGRLRTRL